MTWLINMSITGSITAIIIIFIKALFKNKLSAKWQYYIWVILLIRLLVPALPESQISVFNRMPSMEYAQSNQVTLPALNYNQEATPSQNYNFEHSNNQNLINTNQTTTNNINYIFYAWLIVSALLFMYFLGVYIKFKRKIAKMDDAVERSVLDLLDHCKQRLLIKRDIKVVIGVDTPMLMGIFKPVIILPKGYTLPEIKDIFVNELLHCKHGDVLAVWIATLVLCLNWFNPIMWYCFFAFRKDIELVCDGRVLEIVEDRKSYAELLLKTALRKNKYLLGTTSKQNGEKEITKRIKYIAYFKKPKVCWSIIALAVALIVGGVCLTNAVSNNTNIETTKNISEYNAKTLLSYKTAYVGNNSKVSGIVNNLPVPVGLIREKTVLLTEKAPYGIVVHYDIKNSNGIVIDGSVDRLFLYQNAAVMFSLIDNVDNIKFVLSDNGASYEFSYTRQMADEYFGRDVRQYSKTITDFEEFLMLVQDMNIGKMQSSSFAAVALPQIILDSLNQKGFSLVNKDLVYSQTVILKDNIIFKDPKTGAVLNAEVLAREMGYNLKDIAKVYREAITKYVTDLFTKEYEKHYQVLGFKFYITDYNITKEKVAAVFNLTMSYQNFYKDPDTVDYIKQAKEKNDKNYINYYNEYNAPQQSNYSLKFTADILKGSIDTSSIELLANISPKGKPQYVPVGDLLPKGKV